jgi:hypothetical protein
METLPSRSPRTWSNDTSLTVGTSFTLKRVIRRLFFEARLMLSDLASIAAAIEEAKKSTDKPTIINLKTTIGYGSLGAGGHDVHGARMLRKGHG